MHVSTQPCVFIIPPFLSSAYKCIGPAASSCAESIAVSTALKNDHQNGTENGSIWDLEGSEWRLVNVFSVAGGFIVGAYCPTSDFNESMLEQSRKTLVVGNPTVEVAPLADIKTWIAASQEVKELQAQAEEGRRPKRRKLTTVPRRKVNMVKKYVGVHDKACGLCDSEAGRVQKCYGCNVVVHRACANEDGQTNVLCLPTKVNRWVCGSCYFDAHGGGGEPSEER